MYHYIYIYIYIYIYPPSQLFSSRCLRSGRRLQVGNRLGDTVVDLAPRNEELFDFVGASLRGLDRGCLSKFFPSA